MYVIVLAQQQIRWSKHTDLVFFGILLGTVM
jgi:hypothetical protein